MAYGTDTSNGEAAVNSAPREIRHHMAHCNRDFDFFFNGLEDDKLLVQKCCQCGSLRGLPAPMCPTCQSLEYLAVPLTGRGRIFSYTIHFHPPLPAFETPHAVVLAEMEEGVRILGGMTGVAPEDVCIGAEVQVEFFRQAEAASFRFRPSE